MPNLNHWRVRFWRDSASILRTIVNASPAMRFTHTYAAAAVVFFLNAVPVSSARSSRAKRWVPSDPEAWEVQLGFDPVGRYVATIGMVRSPNIFTALTVDWGAKLFFRFTFIRASLGLELAISASSCPHARLILVWLRLVASPVPRR